MGFTQGSAAWKQEMSDYRVTKIGRGFQPEMLYATKGHPDGQWLPLDREGYWADPDAYSTGNVTKVCPMRHAEAERAVWRAMKINRAT